MRGVNKAIIVKGEKIRLENRGGKQIRRGRRIALRESAYTSRLQDKIIANSFVQFPEKNPDCWIWGMRYQRNGYGSMRAFGNVMPAHRASFLAFKGEITKGLEVAHSCHCRGCVNPNHLRLATHAENMREMRELQKTRAGK